MENYLVDIREFYRGKRVLVTGHTGFKGSWLTFWLSSLGARVYGYSLSPTKESLFKIADISDRDVYRERFDDITNFDTFDAFFNEAQPEVVFHLAAQPIVSEGYRFPRTTFETNVMGTVNVLDCVRRNSDTVKSVVIITTDKVYDDSIEHTNGFVETDPLNGYDPYANSKSCADLATQCYMDSYFKDMNIPCTIFRAGNVIGGGDFAKNRIIPDCIRAWREGEAVELRNPSAVRPYQHVLEPLFAYLVIGATQCQDGISDIFNVGPEVGNCVTTETLVKSISTALYKISGEKLSYTTAEPTMRENPHLTLNVDHLIENGLKPVWDINKTISYTADWYCTSQWNEGDFYVIRNLMSRQIEDYCKDAGLYEQESNHNRS